MSVLRQNSCCPAAPHFSPPQLDSLALFIPHIKRCAFLLRVPSTIAESVHPCTPCIPVPPSPMHNPSTTHVPHEKALAADLEALLAAARAARHVVYDISGSESDFGLLPLILEPRRSSGRGSSSKEPCGTGSSSGGAGLHEGVEGTARGTEAEGAWWSVAEAVAAPLTWGEVAASLGVLAPELVVALAPPEQNVFHDRETFWRCGGVYTIRACARAQWTFSAKGREAVGAVGAVLGRRRRVAGFSE